MFSSDRSGVLNLYEIPFSSQRAASETLLLETAEHKNTTDWSADGRYILYTAQSPTTGNDVWVLPLFGDRTPTPVAQTAASESHGRFSPDGHWIAYTSNEGGQPDVYVQSFPGPGSKSQVSRDGGTHPVWRADGRELFYLAADGTATRWSFLRRGPP